jgi:hypothetical protein
MNSSTGLLVAVVAMLAVAGAQFAAAITSPAVTP